MCLEVTSCCAREAALFANKRILPYMNQHVTFQMRSIDASVAALVATVGLRSVMLNHMCPDVFVHLEGEVALTT